MEHITWSASEKRQARAVFERAAEKESCELLAAFKARAAEAKTMEELWQLRFDLERSDYEREFQAKYDYRYSQLLLVFGRLVREGRILESDLDSLSEEKLAVIRRIVSL
jgi:hypothetical protein